MYQHESFSVPNIKRSVFVRLFVLYLLILLLSLSAVIFIWSRNISDTVNTLSASNIQDVFCIANSNFSGDLNSLYATIDTIANNDVTVNYLSRPDEYNRKQLRSYLDNCYSMLSQNVKGIALMTESDLVFGGYAYFTPKYKEHDWYQQLTESDGSHILFNRCDADSADKQSLSKYSKLSIGKALLKNGETIGVIVCEINNSFILNLYGISTINNSLRTVILDEQKHVLFSSNREFEGEYVENIIVVSEYHNYNNVLHTVTLNNQKYTMISQKLGATPGWINITYLPQEYLYRDYKESLAFAVTCISLIFLAVVLLSYVMLCFWKNKLGKLCCYISNIDITVPSSTRLPKRSRHKDEIDHIYVSVEKMANIMISQLNTISQLEKKKHSYEIQALKAQINPHLIYNTLNVIQTLAKLQKNERISHISDSLSELLHYSVTNTEELVPLSSELQHVQSYLDIMQNKFLNDISLFFTIEEDLTNCLLLKMTLQPFIENSIKHGFTDVAGNYIMIKAYRCDEDVLIKITDNGRGIPKEKLKKLLNDSQDNEVHLGLKNVDRRLKLTFGKKYGLEILSVQNVQTTILINIPYIREEHR